MRLRSISTVTTAPATPSVRADRAASAGADDTWGALMAASQDGHGGAYHRLLGELSEWLHRYFSRRLPPGDVDDAVQETLLAVHRRRHTYDPRQPFGPWLASIAKHKWIDQLRSLGRRPQEELPEHMAVDDHEAAVTSASVLASLLGELRAAQARVILLVKVQGYGIDDAARETGLSPSAVKMNIHRGLAQLATIVENHDDLD